MLEGLVVVLVNIDLVIELIKLLSSWVDVEEGLMGIGWKLGNVLDMLECVGGLDVCCLDDIDVNFGMCDDGLYYLF